MEKVSMEEVIESYAIVFDPDYEHNIIQQDLT